MPSAHLTVKVTYFYEKFSSRPRIIPKAVLSLFKTTHLRS